ELHGDSCSMTGRLTPASRSQNACGAGVKPIDHSRTWMARYAHSLQRGNTPITSAARAVNSALGNFEHGAPSRSTIQETTHEYDPSQERPSTDCGIVARRCDRHGIGGRGAGAGRE